MITNDISLNKFDRRLILMIASMAFGTLGGALSVTRVLTIIFAPSLLSLAHDTYNFKAFRTFFVLLICYCVISLLWTLDKSQGFNDTIYFFIHGLTFMEIIAFSSRTTNPVKSIMYGWMIAFILTAIVAMFEIFTDWHFSISKHGSGSYIYDGNTAVLQQFASVTFYNPNNYVSFVGCCLPFIFAFVPPTFKLDKLNIISYGSIILATIILFFNSSRGGIATLFLISFLFVIFRTFINSSLSQKVSVIIFLGIACFLFFYYGSNLLRFIEIRLANQEMFKDANRTQIWHVAYSCFRESFGFGTGVGSLAAVMQKTGFYYGAAHNFFIELLVQFGVLFFGIFIIFLMNLFCKSFRKKNDDKSRFIVISAVLSFFVISIISSGYLTCAYIYIYFATLYVVANHEHYGLSN